MDFLSNGFHQLYSELDDEFSMWDYTSNSAMREFDVNANQNNNKNNSNGSSGSSIGSNSSCYNSNRTCDYYSFVDNHESFELTNILINDYGRTFESFSSDYENSLDCINSNSIHIREHDWEHSFLDNYIEIPALTDLLPERTPLCNESCNIFLKESSDNLIKFRPSCGGDHLMKDHKFGSIETDNEKTFPCTFGTCTKVYAKPAHLKAHIRRHLGDKPYVCTWPNCSWKFSRSDELARHRRSHSGVKPYKCNYCTKCFSRSDHLAKHRKVHERKIAANKSKGIILGNIQQVKPGRKPKENKVNRN